MEKAKSLELMTHKEMMEIVRSITSEFGNGLEAHRAFMEAGFKCMGKAYQSGLYIIDEVIGPCGRVL